MNITLLIQMGNFWIAYWLLRELLFKPVIAIIESQDEERNSLLQKITIAEQHISDIHHERQKHWHDFKTHCQNNAPDFLLQQKDDLLETQEIKPHQISPAEVATLTQQVKKYLVTHLTRG